MNENLIGAYVESAEPEINQKLREDEKREWDFKMQKYNDEIARQKREFELKKEKQDAEIAYQTKKLANTHEERMVLIGACREVGLAFANNINPSGNTASTVKSW